MKGVIPAPRCAYAHNLLDNSDFRNPINQRGQSSYTTPLGYSLDRWYTFDSRGAGEEAQTLTIISGGIRLTGAHAGITQRIPLIDGAKTYTLAYMDTSGKRDCCAFLGSTVNLPQYGFATVSISPGDGAEIVWAALYEGTYTAETLPPYQPKGYAAELAECMRYFVRFGREGQTVHVGYAQAATSSIANATLSIPAPMRDQPTVQLSGKMYLRKGTTDISPTSISINTATAAPCIYMAIEASGLTAGQMYAIRLADGAAIDFSADL